MSLEIGRKAQPSNFDYMTGNLMCIPVPLPHLEATDTDNITVDIDFAFPTGLQVQLLGFGITGNTITDGVLTCGSLVVSNGYLVAKTNIDAPTYFPCDGSLANPETQSALVDTTVAQSLRITAAITAGVWDAGVIYVWCIPTVAPTDSTTS